MHAHSPTKTALPAICATLATIALTGCAAPRQADVIWRNGNIYTLDPHRPRTEALAVADGRILATGPDDEVMTHASPTTRIIDLAGRTAIPGLIDAHGHMTALGRFGLGLIDLSDARSFDEVVARIAERAGDLAPGEWIVGGRWDHESWPDRRLPTHEALSAATPDNPVWLTRVDGHAGIANAAAMRLARITAETPDPPGGEIIRDSSGQPTGVLIDRAQELIERLLPKALTADPEALILKAQQMCLSTGLVGVHDAGVSPDEIEAYRRLDASGALKLRMYLMVAGRHALEYFAHHRPCTGERLSIRACKLYMDGALGSRGAWLLEPYSDRPTDRAGRPYTGLRVGDLAQMERICADALRRGYQVCTHAIGDRANRETLALYRRALKRKPRHNHRFRIEHAQIVNPGDIAAFRDLGVIASMQPTHATSDMRWAEDRLGPDRLAGAYAWASFLKAGVCVAGGSDFPVESHNPFLGVYAAVTRQDLKGEPEGGWLPEQRLTREEALRLFTVNAAYASFEEDSRGSLEPGKWADFVVIDRDIMTCDADRIPATRVLRTVIAGEVVYDATSESTD